MFNHLVMSIALLGSAPLQSHRRSDDGFPVSFAFPVTVQASESVRCSRHILRGGVSFGEWCVESLADYPWVAIDGRFNCVMGSGPAATSDLLRRMLDTGSARDMLLAYPKIASSPVHDLPGAAVISYLYTTAHYFGGNSRIPESSCAQARSFLLSIIGSRSRLNLSAEVAVSALLLANLTPDTSLRDDLLKLVYDRSQGSLQPFGLSAAVIEVRCMVSDDSVDSAKKLAVQALDKYKSLAKWRNYEILKEVAVDPVRAVKAYVPIV